jgi:hypothetical protein
MLYRSGYPIGEVGTEYWDEMVRLTLVDHMAGRPAPTKTP